MADVDVLIVGAGPTGLVCALWLTRLGVRVRIVDQNAAPVRTSRAVAVQARTLELYGQMGLADELVARGRKALAANMWVAGRRVARAELGDMGVGISPYPFALIFPQDEHEALLVAHLAAAGVEIERQTELVDFVQHDDRIVARLKRNGGATLGCEALYIAGCDGAHSAVRERLAIGFPGGTYEHVFYVADVEGGGPAMNGEIHVALDSHDFLAVFPLTAPGHARLVGTIRESIAAGHDEVGWRDVSKRVIDWMRVDVATVNWFSTYRVHHRVATRFRSDRAFLLGDAAHIHSPVGGQGMNTGIGDAINLAWKLAAVIRGEASEAILDTYETERIAFAQRLVATTDRVFTGATSSTALARAVRLRLVPVLFPALFASRIVRRFAFRAISQTGIAYRRSWLSEGRAGAVAGGDRLPWTRVRIGARETDNFEPLASIGWQMHVYGAVSAPFEAECRRSGVALHRFEWSPPMRRNGLRPNVAYLVRPDGYLALVDKRQDPQRLSRYCERVRATASTLPPRRTA